jgi:hypothetical protein
MAIYLKFAKKKLFNDFYFIFLICCVESSVKWFLWHDNTFDEENLYFFKSIIALNLSLHFTLSSMQLVYEEVL